MSLHPGNPTGRPVRYFTVLRAWMVRSGRALGATVTPVLAELRYLNRIGADARSRADRVAAVKQTLARRSEGPNRCC